MTRWEKVCPHSALMSFEQLDREITILENIYNNKEQVRQRDLAHVTGISLGMTNAILKRLITKGLVTAKKINRRNIHYAVTPAGIQEIMKRSYRYLKRTIKNISRYKERIDRLIVSAKNRGYHEVVLVGKSDLDFIVEYTALEHGLSYTAVPRIPSARLEALQAAASSSSPKTDFSGAVQSNDAFYIISEKSRTQTALPGAAWVLLFDELKQ
ncbi:MAG TPA: winged helix-turn-helix transcriptional regulator [Spirochaetia bacterium]|nr:winged helix-turn-helix transcriptional regulator [Spirochaetia bacterium]